MEDPTDAKPALTWATVAIATAGIVLMLINPASLTSWLDQQDPESVPPQARTVIGALWDFDASLGLTTPRAGIAAAWSRARTASWPTPGPASKVQR